jgi:hypothetical protein
VPRLLPWLAILGLLALKSNRGWSAWWIGLPLGALTAAYQWLQQVWQSPFGNGSGEAVEILLAMPLAWGFGLAALWLLADCLRRRDRLVGFVGRLAVLAFFILFSFGTKVGWGLIAEPIASLLDPRHCAATANVGLMGLPLLIPLVLPAPAVAGALVLCGLACRGRYRAVGLWVWLVIALLTGWIAVSALLYGLCHVASPGVTGYRPFLGMGLFMAILNSAILLPFLILSAASPFFRERLKALSSTA